MVQLEFENAWKSADTKLSVAGLAGLTSGLASEAARASGDEFSDVSLKTGVRLRYAY
jgi:hypothetical protein